MQLTSSTAPAAASWLAARRRAQSNWSPAKIYSGSSSSCRNSHGRSAPADGRKAGCRWRPGPAPPVPVHCVELHKQVPQQAIQRLRRVADLVIATAAANQFQPVQRALAGQRLVQLPLAAEQCQQRIAAQLLMIAEILVAQRQTEDALRQHLRELVRDQQRRSAIDKAGRQTTQQVDLAVHLTQQQRTAVAGNLTSRNRASRG